MKYPSSIHDRLTEVEKIVSTWPINIEIDHVIKWILQFDPSDYHIALRIINNLNVIGYDDLNGALQVAYSRLLRMAKDKNTVIKGENTVFAGIGDAGKSGSMISYHFRLINDISEENFLDDDSFHHIEKERVENIVLLDDIISTGRQATQEINILTEKVTPFKVRNIFLLTVCGMNEGITKITDDTKALTFSAFQYGKEDTIDSLDSRFYEGVLHDNRKEMRERIEYYGKISINGENGLGFGGVGGLIVFPYNTPNTTLPIIWSDKNGWIPLFKRVKRVNGISSFYKKMDLAIEKKVGLEQSQSDQKSVSKNLNLYVEGKTDEDFFSILNEKFGLSTRLKLDKITIIALGGAFLSENLIKILSDLGEKSLFIFENDDVFYPHAKSPGSIIKEKFPDLPIVYLEPSIMYFIKIHEMLKDPKYGPSLERAFGEDILTDQLYTDSKYLYEIEKHLKMRYKNRIKEIFEKFLDHEKVELFIKEVSNRIHDQDSRTILN